MDLSQNVKAVEEKIAAAARAAGRDPGEIALCAATKVQTDDTVRAAVAAGVRVCGENRVQELSAHLDPAAYTGRCAQQVEAFLSQCVAPVLERYAGALEGKETELNV